MSNPFDAPQAPPPAGPSGGGVLDLFAAFQVALKTLGDNLLILSLASLLTMLGYLIAGALCFFPLIFVGPLLFWGHVHLTLDALDGRATLETLTAGFSRVGDVWLPTFGLVALLFIASLPGTVVGKAISVAFSVAGNGEDLLAFFGVILGSLISLGWSVGIMCRFFAAPYLLVSQNMAPTDALVRSWNLTSGVNWLYAALLMVLSTIVSMVGVMLLFVGIIPAYALTMLLAAEATRQLLRA